MPLWALPTKINVNIKISSNKIYKLSEFKWKWFVLFCQFPAGTSYFGCDVV